MNKNFKILGTIEFKFRDKNDKPIAIFQSNKLWFILKSIFGINLKIPFLTGRYKSHFVYHNAITTAGKQAIISHLKGDPAKIITQMALGQGVPTDTALGNEMLSGGGEKKNADIAIITKNITNDTLSCKALFEFTQSVQITEEGLFSSDGTLLASASFNAFHLEAGSKFEETHNITVVD